MQRWNFTSLEQQRDDVIASFKASDAKIARRIGSDDFPVEGDKHDPALWLHLRERETNEDFRDEMNSSRCTRIQECWMPRMTSQHQGRGGRAPKYGASITKRRRSPTCGCAPKMELALPRGEEDPQIARVNWRNLDQDANGIAENLFAQVDQDGQRLLLMDEII